MPLDCIIETEKPYVWFKKKSLDDAQDYIMSLEFAEGDIKMRLLLNILGSSLS